MNQNRSNHFTNINYYQTNQTRPVAPLIEIILNQIKTDFCLKFKFKRGFTLEFYNRTFGYMMARLLYNLKVSFMNEPSSNEQQK